MSGSGQIGVVELLIFYGVLLLPLLMLWYLGLKDLVKNLLVGVGRMTLQLAMIGVYLEFLFAQNSLVLNLLWLAIMLLVANWHILSRAGLSITSLFMVSLFSVFFGVGLVLVAMIVLVQPEPWFSSRYLIPLAGMLLGNCLTGNILVLERFYGSVSERYEQYMGDLLLGASRLEALQPFIRGALKSAISPLVATLSTLGLVALPGMMTGQILGGAEPVDAVMYQLMIMLGIASSMILCAIINLMLNIRVSFDRYGLMDFSMIKAESH
ncbi:ABC transporter permease [Endozoicomonas ascidiicola]|uniref:ABC transporter permease n=1 Tax=Endozoicomonas ascidiicola TaxID=1698521 RepID=UPI00082ADAD3|nr:ABC transporter permease [Endozoicomonas ascidiicola]